MKDNGVSGVVESRYNEFDKKTITLEPDEIFCDKCNGTGVVQEYAHVRRLYNGETFTQRSVYCEKCNSYGKLTWIENVFGVTQGRSSTSGTSGIS